jgi:hypothetical protein
MPCECDGECDLAEGYPPGCGHPTATANPTHALDGKSYCHPCYVRVSTARALREAVEGLPRRPEGRQLAPVLEALLSFGPHWLRDGAVEDASGERDPDGAIADIVEAADGLPLDEILDRLAADAPSSSAKKLLTRLAAHVRDLASRRPGVDS